MESSGFRVWGLEGFGGRVGSLGFRVPGLGFRVSDFRFGVLSFGLKVEGGQLRVQGIGGWGPRLWVSALSWGSEPWDPTALWVAVSRERILYY